MATVTAIDHVLRGTARRCTHLVKWVDYHSGGGAQPSGCPARLTFYSSSPGRDDAVIEALELLEGAA